MQTKQKGDISEQAFILEALKRGYAISRPVGDRLPYDCIVDTNGVLFKVQIKTAYIATDKGNSGLLMSQGMRNSLSNKRTITYRWYGEGDFDILATYDPTDQRFFIIPGPLVIKEHRTQMKYTWRGQRVGNPDWGSYKDRWDLFTIN